MSTAQNFKNCRDEDKILKVVTYKKKYTTLSATVEPNEEMQIDFGDPLPDERDKEVYILAGFDQRFPSHEKY